MIHINAPNKYSGFICADVDNILFSGWNEELIFSSYKMKTISFTTDCPFHLNLKSVPWTDPTLVQRWFLIWEIMESATGHNMSVGGWLKMEEELFNKQRGVQHEPHGGFTVHFIVCIYISTILNKHLSASNCILKHETRTHTRTYPWHQQLAKGNGLKRVNKCAPCCLLCQRLWVIIS